MFLADKASDPKLKERLSKAAEGIKDQTATVEKLLRKFGSWSGMMGRRWWSMRPAARRP